MKNFIENKKVIAIFSDTAGGKAVLSYLNIFQSSANKIKVFSNKKNPNYSQFEIPINNPSKYSQKEFLEESDLLITGTSLPINLELEWIKKAKMKNIFSISFIDHWTNLKKRFQVNESLYYPDLICLIDEEAKKIALKQGIPEELICIIGNPYYKFLESWKPKLSKKDFLKSLNIKHNNYILFSPEPFLKFNLDNKYGFNEIDGLNFLIEILNKLKLNLTLIVKAHPSENKHPLEKELKKISKIDYLYLKECDMNHLIYYSYANIGFFSNSLIESSILGIKTIRILSLLKDKNLDPLKHLSKNKFIDINTKDELFNLLKDK